jgi:hypothetical protein
MSDFNVSERPEIRDIRFEVIDKSQFQQDLANGNFRLGNIKNTIFGFYFCVTNTYVRIQDNIDPLWLKLIQEFGSMLCAQLIELTYLRVYPLWLKISHPTINFEGYKYIQVNNRKQISCIVEQIENLEPTYYPFIESRSIFNFTDLLWESRISAHPRFIESVAEYRRYFHQEDEREEIKTKRREWLAKQKF